MGFVPTKNTSEEVFFDVTNPMEAGETAPKGIPGQPGETIGIRLATLAPGQTAGAARRNQNRE
jgi:hypothetical protein